MKNEAKGKSVSGLAALAVFGLFALCVLWVLLSGAGVYARLTQRGSAAYDSRTAVQYVCTKLRQSAMPEKTRVAPFGSGDALYLYEEIDGEAYLNRIYCHEGWLMELFTAAEADMAPGDGERILPLESMEIRRRGELLSFTLGFEGGEERSFQSLLRTGGGEP